MGANERKSVIEISDLNSYYGERQVLSGINLDVIEKEILVIMGHSGSGKSTLLKHMLGLKSTLEGNVAIRNTSLCSMSQTELFELRKSIGVAFQGGALFSSMSLIENIELPLKQHTRLDKKTIRIMARMKLEMMDLLDYELLMPAELSGGMLKRAGLARAIVMDPDLLFFDEPSSGLDPVTSAQLDEDIKQLRDVMNMTVVVITHDLDSALNIADRLTVLHEGKQIVTGSVADIRACEDVRVQGILNRTVHVENMDSHSYLDQLTR